MPGPRGPALSAISMSIATSMPDTLVVTLSLSQGALPYRPEALFASIAR